MDKEDSKVRVDAHQHFWVYKKEEYRWIDDSMALLRRDFLPHHLKVMLETRGIDYTIAVQARQTLQESDWLLELADQNDFIKGIVGWVDLTSSYVTEDLERLSAHEMFRGVRHLLQDEEDDRYMLRKDFKRGISELGKYGLTFDLLISPIHIKYACELVNQFPNQRFVVDHFATPSIKRREIEPWKRDMKEIAKAENVYCKISGMVTEASWGSWKQEDFIPYMEAILDMFGTKRLMFGSDWPVCTVAAEYEKVLGIVTDFISSLSPLEQSKIMGLNAIDFYSLVL